MKPPAKERAKVMDTSKAKLRTGQESHRPLRLWIHLRDYRGFDL